MINQKPFDIPRYNIPDAPQNSGFTLTAAQEGSDLNVCGKVGGYSTTKFNNIFLQYTGNQLETEMVVMEVEMVSGLL